MNIIENHIIRKDKTVRDALIQLDLVAPSSILFVVENDNALLGSLTDGDLRRGFIKGLGFENSLLEFVKPNPVFIKNGQYNIEQLDQYRKDLLRIIPIVDDNNIIIDILDFNINQTLIPVDAIIMAGGEGKRLRPLTEMTPKPLLKVGDKPIIEHNIDRLKSFGVKNIHLSINYLGEQLVEYFGNGSRKSLNIKYVKENKPLGTIGSVLLIDKFFHDDIIVMNSDLLTNIDFADFYQSFKKAEADMAVATTSYHVDVPYGVLEIGEGTEVKSLKEKPRYTYYSNAGIYLLKSKVISMIPENEFYNVTDLMERVLEMNLRLITYPINGYWLDIGKHEDFKKAQEDIKHIRL